MDPETRNTPHHAEQAACGTQNSYETAYHDAARILASSPANVIAHKSGAAVKPCGAGHAISFAFLGDDIMVSHPDISISFKDRNEEVALWAKILILHYLVRAGGASYRNEPITFKQLEGGMAYDPAFQRRSIAPLFGPFGSDPERLMRAGISAGGRSVPVGDFGLAFTAFPRVEVAFALWKGDAEFPPSGTVIFDSSIADYLSTEDVAVLCNMIAVKIAKAFRGRA